jgi:dUTP pyrophosphatase
MTEIEIINKSGHPDPFYATELSAGMDLYACIEEQIMLNPLERKLVGTGIYIALPPATEAQIRPKSGLAYKQGISVLNTPGTIDADYRGEVGVVLINLGQTPVAITRGMRIAQLVVAPHCFVAWDDRTGAGEALAPTPRGAGGFGSTGRSVP